MRVYLLQINQLFLVGVRQEAADHDGLGLVQVSFWAMGFLCTRAWIVKRSDFVKMVGRGVTREAGAGCKTGPALRFCDLFFSPLFFGDRGWELQKALFEFSS